MNGRKVLKVLNSASVGMTAVGINVQVLEVSGQAPGWIPLVPAGQVVGRDGREWVNDSPQLVLDAFAAGSADIPLDMEHATELKAPQGEPAPAVGWIKELQIRDGQIWGRVDWTEAGRNAVESKAYRYVSPVFVFERASKRVVALTSAALTNRPNLFLQALNGKENSMNLEELLAALGLPKGTTFEAALAHIGKIKGDLATATNAAASPPLDKFVPRADFDAVLGRASNAETALAALKKADQTKAIDQAITGALAAGKITPATEAYHRAQCAQEGGLDRFAEFVAAAPVIADPSSMESKRPEDQGKALNAEEERIAAMFGNTAEDLRKYGK